VQAQYHMKRVMLAGCWVIECECVYVDCVCSFQSMTMSIVATHTSMDMTGTFHPWVCSSLYFLAF